MPVTALRLSSALLLSLPLLACGLASALADQVQAVHATGAATWTESGQATWYGGIHEGRRTSSGERFDSTKMTAAHPSLPLGSFVRVTDVSTGRSIVVRVNDREPPHGVRCIDLSHGAATRLGFAARGVADVTLAQISAQEAHGLDIEGQDQELAEAPDDAVPAGTHVTARHGRRHTHHARR